MDTKRDITDTDSTADKLGRLLRIEMTAVNQQFIHILALRRWGHRATADRITKVDDVDFPNAMRLMDHLVGLGRPLEIEGDSFRPGQSHAGILAAELELERRFAECLCALEFDAERPKALLDTARAPRADYVEWLQTQIGDENISPSREQPGTIEAAVLFGHLLTVMEQSLAHAFVFRHGTRNDLSDFAWSTSGAAMMQTTHFVGCYAAQSAVPVPKNMPSYRVECDLDSALERETQLAGSCVSIAETAAKSSETPEMKELCHAVALFYEELANTRPGERHPATDSNPAAFRSFEETLTKFDV